jgi:hypothetical protein
MAQARTKTARRCDWCGEKRVKGKRLTAKKGQPAVWLCNDCQRMLLLRVDDQGTPGD